MTSYIALLRGINVGGHKQIAMADLRHLVIDLGFTDPQSLLQSGNLIVMLLKTAPRSENVEALRAAITGPEIVSADDRHAYIVYPNGIGRSRLTITLIERMLATRETGRNWNTVLRLGALGAS